MLKLKSNWTCSYCAKILKNSIILPCDDSICREHLTEKAVVNANKIKCHECNLEFPVKENQFKANRIFNKLLDNQSYLSKDEMSLKRKIEETIEKFFQFYDQIVQNRNNLESDLFDHFQEIRFQIDEHREEVKKRIDDIALAMIDRTKKNEEIYLKNLKERFSSFDHGKSLEHELNEIEETFRDPNLLIQTIQDMQCKQEESLKYIELKLNEMNQVKDNLIATNKFKPNLSLFNQKEETFFGSIKLNGHWLNSLGSKIIKGEQECSEFIKLCEFSSNDKWSLLYRATRDGFGSKDFHSRCDGHANTLTILKAKGSEFIFGGFTTVEWESSNCFISDRNAFIFSLTNIDNKPLKMKVNPRRHEYAIRCHSSFGPTFAGDIHVANKANITMGSYSNLGRSYRHPQYAYETDEAQTFLAGSNRFQLDEIEVYEKE